MDKEKILNLPNKSGIYQYFDKNKNLLYIGKAKNLKNRVKSYFQFIPILAPASKLSQRIKIMINQVVFLEYIVVNSESDALILENSLIKQLKPKYNILLRDDKTYPYLYIDFLQDFPRVELTRKILKGNGIKYYGPFSSGAREILASIYNIIPLVQKKSCLKSKKACLFYQINRCKAPCEGKITKLEYKKLLDNAINLIKNKSKLIDILKQKMEKLSLELRFEDAKEIRDKILSIKKSEISSVIDFATDENIDIFGIKHLENRVVIIKMFIRDGRIISTSHNYLTINFQFDLDEIFRRAIINYYITDIPITPNQILITHNIDKLDLENFLKDKFNKNINITIPKIGKKKELIDIVLNNCDELLKIDTFRDNNQLFKDIQNLFHLKVIPFRVESFDNSHLMGEAIVGAMVVYENNKPIKSDYRVYNLESKDEYGQMREMLMRRVESFKKNPPPDLWVIDGGATLLTLANNILESIGVDIDIIAIAKEKRDFKAYRSKGGAKDIIYIKDKIFNLSPNDIILQFIQKLRDEAHRVAITSHKKQKRVKDKKISLLSVKGIGEAKIRKLLNYFGTFENIKSASIDEFENILNKKDALNLINYVKNL